MEKIVLLLVFLFHPLLSIAQKEVIKFKKNDTAHEIDTWFNTYSCNELETEELRSICKELKIINAKWDGNPDHLESELAHYYCEISKKHFHEECFLAVEKVCEIAILNPFGIFQDVVLAYLKKITDAVAQRVVKKHYKIS